ncbi:MAG TPA: ABC transporter ATP-binding protein [Acetobacteraceae bacterium]|nr:ABC transporter ATP-binding protein [Acetobacteraceae bacterium]
MRADGDARPILQIVEIGKRFGPAVVADRLTLTIQRGEFFTFLGPSGSGKSTILRMIAGLERPDQGTIRLEGRDVSAVPPWRRKLGMMFQQYAIFPHMTVAENVAYGLKVRGIGHAEAAARVMRMLELVGLTGMERKNATLLSGGEQQRVALARALAPEPRMLLLDEPLSALDEKTRRSMRAELKDVHRKTGTTFLYVTHDQEEALTMSDRIAVLNRGVCMQCDTPERLYRAPHTRFVAEFFRGWNVLTAQCRKISPGCNSVSLAGSDIRLPHSPDSAPVAHGAEIHLAIRAENVRLGASLDPRCVQLPAKLLECVFRGTAFDHTLELWDGQRLIASSTQNVPMVGGGPTVVQILPADLLLLAD